MQQIEAARREIISRAYVEKIGEGAPKPTPAEVSAYYEKHPALFADRRDLQPAGGRHRGAAGAGRGAEGGAGRRQDLRRSSSTTSRRTTSSSRARRAFVPPSSCRSPASSSSRTLKDGQAIFVARPNGARVIHLVGSRSQPVNLEAATPGDRAVPAQRTQAQARRRRSARPARCRQDRIRRRLRRRTSRRRCRCRRRTLPPLTSIAAAAGLRRRGGAADRRGSDERLRRRRCRAATRSTRVSRG